MRVLIVEDEPAIARRIERMTREILGSRDALFEVFHRASDARSALDSGSVDLLILDLHLDGCDGFQLFEEAFDRVQRTVVVSAHTDQAIRAFDLGVIDFVRKPFGRERLAQAIDRAFCLRPPEPLEGFLAIRRPGGVERVAIADLVYARGAGSYSRLMLRSGIVELYPGPLDRLTQRLPSAFVRTHRSFVVCLDLVKSLRVLEGSRYELVLEDGTRLPIGRTRIDEVRRRFGGAGAGRR